LTAESLENVFETKFQQKSFPNSQTLDLAGLQGRAMSASYMPSEGDERCSKMLERIESVFAEFEEKGRIIILYDTNVFYTQF
jgi:hypothetical protein